MEIKWTERLLDEYRVSDLKEREENLEQSAKESNIGYLECIYKRI